ncbi:HAL protein kinase [Apiospora phragmitis]|uniref:HAL protein kinase n=1 Tax=Apiospora phragmitis TaxID=2905665 RepID=A0ABR1VWP5_9PEZI
MASPRTMVAAALCGTPPTHLQKKTQTQQRQRLVLVLALSHFTCAPIPILQPQQSQSHAGLSNNSYPASSLSSSPRRYPTDLSGPIPEEDDETESESANEPITPVSGRESREFQTLLDLPSSDQRQLETGLIASPDIVADSTTTTTTPNTGESTSTTTTTTSAAATGLSQKAYRRPPPLVVETAATPPRAPQRQDPSSSATDAGSGQLIEDQSPKASKSLTLTAANNPTCSATSPEPTSKFGQETPTSTSPRSDCSPTNSNRTSFVSQYQYQQPSLLEQQQQQQYQSEHPSEASPPPRRPSLGNLSLRGASKSFLGVGTKMTSLFRRSASNVTDGATMEFREPVYQNGGAAGAVLDTTTSNTPAKATPSSSRRFSFHPSRPETRSNSPPSPASPASKDAGSVPSSVPSSSDFLSNKKKTHTGFSLRSRVNFVSGPRKEMRRTRSVERSKKAQEHLDLTRQPWALPPDAGTGMKARRLSLSLPDDFTVDVAELLKEFEYQHKLLGRHGKHLGKGATSKVTLMVRKGSPGEMYAVKEFRSKRSVESDKDYQKKIKSEFSIAKSLHHPNIVETVRLCTDHGRWNHVMEYCSEGDLFSLVSKKYLMEEGREVDRHCLFKQVCQGIHYLHSNGIAHRDIKLENLLITKDSKVKITDFGVSEVFSGIHPGLREAGGQCGQGMNGEIRLCKPGICGSLPYIAPEVLSKQRDYDPRPLDVWSSAIVMIYLIFGANIWEKAEWQNDAKTAGQYNKLVLAYEKYNARVAKNPDATKDALPHLDAFDYCVKPLALRRLLLKMLNPDPEKRWTMAEVVTSRWFKTIECCQMDSYDDPVKFIDASKKNATISTAGKIYCHNHLPPQNHGHGLPPMPGKAGY